MIYFSMPYKAYEFALADKELKRKVFALGYPQRSNKWGLHFEEWVPAKYRVQAKIILAELKEVYNARKCR